MPFSILLQHCAPQHLLSRLTGILARCRIKWFKNWSIRRLIRVHGVNLSEAASTNLDDYPCFNSFFTRSLRPECRPLVAGPKKIASPVDGSVSQAGVIQNGTIFQAKGFDYSAISLLGGSAARAALFDQGQFATFYLAPGDYHRVHMPCDGKLLNTVYVPGRLYSVNPETVSHVPQLFSKNERLICLFETEAGPMAMILVAAMLVGQIQTVWSEHVASKNIAIKNPGAVILKKGGEIGRFLMGSTVIVLFAQNSMQWDTRIQEGCGVKMGEGIGNFS